MGEISSFHLQELNSAVSMMPAKPFLRVTKTHMLRVGMMKQSKKKTGTRVRMWMWTTRRRGLGRRRRRRRRRRRG